MSVTVRALKDGVVIGSAMKPIVLVAGCTNASITLEAASVGDLGTPDLTPAMPDLVGVPVIACTSPSESTSGISSSARDAYRRSFYPGARLLDPMTIGYETDDWFEVLRLLQFVTG